MWYDAGGKSLNAPRTWLVSEFDVMQHVTLHTHRPVMSRYSKYNCWKPSKKRSIAQLQVTALMKFWTTYQHGQNKENIAPLATTSSSPSVILNTELERERKCKNAYQSCYRNEKRCHECTKSRTNKLQSHCDEAWASTTKASLQVQTTQHALATTQHKMRCLEARNKALTKHNHALAMHTSWVPLQKAQAVDKALACTAVQAEKRDTFSLKEKNVITDEVHDMICELVAKHNVPVSSVQDIIHMLRAVSEWLLTVTSAHAVFVV